jgi:hypothetical protein
MSGTYLICVQVVQTTDYRPSVYVPEVGHKKITPGSGVSGISTITSLLQKLKG